MLRKPGTILPVALLLLLGSSLRLHAQITGCDDSPESPTLVLGLIVGAASLGYTRLRLHLRSHDPKQK